jgi:hypothetical protein
MRLRVVGSSAAEVPWKYGARSPSVPWRGDEDVEAPPVKTIRARVRASEAFATIGVAESSGNRRRELAAGGRQLSDCEAKPPCGVIRNATVSPEALASSSLSSSTSAVLASMQISIPWVSMT